MSYRKKAKEPETADQEEEVNIDKKLKELKKIPDLYQFVMENAFLAGGAVRDITRGQKPKDYDIFFKTKIAKEEFVKRFSKHMKETGIGNYNWYDFQFITIRYGTPEEVTDTFDWNVNKVFYDFNRSRLGGNMFGGNELTLNTKSDKPLSALLRLPYLLKKGFTIDEKELLFALTFTSTVVNLRSTEAVEEQHEFMSNGGGETYLGDTVERAVQAALEKSPLNKALL